MKNIYPEKIEIEEIKLLNRGEVASEVIEQMKEGKTKAQAIGPVLKGSNDVATFNSVWNCIIKEGKHCRSINPADHLRLASYKESMEDGVNYIDVDDFYNGLLEEKDVSSFAQLKKLMED